MAKVLLAEDEEALRLLLSRQLRRAGHEVTLAEDGVVAAELLERETFDVVVSDMKMPRLDGMGLLERASQITPTTEFIILTGHGSLESAVEAFKTGHVFDYLLKPLEDIRELDAVVDRAVERRHLIQENARLLTQMELQIEELEVAKNRLTLIVDQDSLTGLYNHKAIHRQLEGLLADPSIRPLSTLMLDMDGFKLINDIYGHPIGDHILRHLATALQTVYGSRALIGRCGGDEFMVVIPNCDAARATVSANEVRLHLVEHPFISPDGSRLPLQLCFGVCDTNTAGDSAASLVTAADTALYEGKRQGGDRITLHMSYSAEEGGDGNGNFQILDSLVTTIDRKDHYTKKHSEEVTRYAMDLVGALNLSPDTMNAVRVAGLLHDIGKIGIPDYILRKPGKLTEGEYEIMKGHVSLSALIIHGLPRLNDVLDAVAHHHERWDGQGYPSGIAGTDIPLLGRVMAIADAFSAMTSDRPYRARLTLEQAILEIEQGGGNQFDPELAQLFVEMMRANANGVRMAA